MWLLAKNIWDKLQAATTTGREATREQAIEIAAFIGWEVSDVLTTSGGKGVIDIFGVLTQEPDPFAAVFADANTTYSAIIDAVHAAEGDPDVKEIILNINSPGGQFDGMLETMEAIRETKKPTRAEVGGIAASAAFGLASSADEIVATNRTASFGSVGVVAEFFIDDDMVTITNTGSPDKRPDPATAEGRATIQAQLDDAFNLFAEGIAAGRGIEASDVAEKFGKGGTFFAEKAREMGMVDRVEKSSQNTSQSSSTATPTKASSVKEPKILTTKPVKGVQMDLATLKAQHPELIALIVAEATAGIQTSALEVERKRVNAHLHMGAESGDMDTALAAIKDGSEMDAELTAKYVMATAKKTAIGHRQDDNVDLDNNGDDLVDDVEKDKKASDGILSAACSRLNVEV